MVAALSGVDAVAFTGGVGEGSAAVREGALVGLEFLGVAVNSGQNEAARGDANVSAPGAPVSVAVVTAREDLEAPPPPGAGGGGGGGGGAPPPTPAGDRLTAAARRPSRA